MSASEPGGQYAFAREQAIQLGGVLCQHTAHGAQADLLLGHAEGVNQLAAGLHAGDAAGNSGEIVAACQLLLGSEAAVVGGHGLHLTPADGPPQGLTVSRFPDGRRADVFGRLQPVLVIIHAVIQYQILGARLHKKTFWPRQRALAISSSASMLVVWTMTTGMSTCSAMRSRRPTASASMMSGRVSGWQWTPFSPAAFFFGDQRVDDPGVFAVDAADAALFLQLFSALYMASSPIIMAG